MAHYAEKFGEDEEKWRICGLLHDVDYEKVGDEHPSEMTREILGKAGVSEEMIDAIMGHAHEATSEDRKTIMAKTLFAVDRLSGFVVACALVRPGKLGDVKVSSVKNSMKKKEFAKNVDRDEIRQGAEDLGVELDDHIANVIEAMMNIRKELGL